MGLITLPLLLIVYWIIDKIERYNAEKDYERFIEEKRKRG